MNKAVELYESIGIDKIPSKESIRAVLQAAKEDYVYSYKDGNRVVKGVSWLGARALGYYFGVTILSVDVKDTGDSYSAIAKAEWQGRTAFGGAVQHKEMKLREGGTREDNSAMQKAMNKAQRNAILNLLPIPKVVVEEISITNTEPSRAIEERKVKTWKVPSETDPNTVYVVKREKAENGFASWSCSCPGYMFNGECKHIEHVQKKW